MTLPPIATPGHDVEVSVELVAALLERHLPRFAGRPLTMGPNGWDNVVVRIGDDLAARLPRRQLAAEISPSELDWLPRVGSDWTFPCPLPIAVGPPDAALGYPWRWSVVPWLEGDLALTSPLSAVGAAQLGAALAQVHQPAPAGTPLNPFRSQPLSSRAERLDARLATAGVTPGWTLDADAVRAAVSAADAWEGGTYCHLDLHGNNVLTRDGDLAGILDWGDSGAGDAATDLGQAWYMVGTELFAELAGAYTAAGGSADPGASRVRAEALTYAVTMASLEDEAYAASGWKALEDLGVARRG